MKATVNGIELEGSPREIREYIASLETADELQPQKSTQTKTRQTVEPCLAELLQIVTKSQQETFYALPDKHNRNGIAVHVLATKLDISPKAASQRCLTLQKLGLAQRVKRGQYKRTA